MLFNLPSNFCPYQSCRFLRHAWHYTTSVSFTILSFRPVNPSFHFFAQEWPLQVRMEVLHFSAHRSGGRRAEDSGSLLWRRQRAAGQPQGRAGVFDCLRKLFTLELFLLFRKSYVRNIWPSFKWRLRVWCSIFRCDRNRKWCVHDLLKLSSVMCILRLLFLYKHACHYVCIILLLFFPPILPLCQWWISRKMCHDAWTG